MPTVSGVIYDSTASAVAGRTVRAYRRDTGVLLGSATSSDGNEIPGDTLYNSVVALLRFNDTDGATSFMDESATPKTVTRSGDAQIDTAQSQWGGASVLMDGAGDLLTIASHAGLAIGTSDFCIEFAVRRSSDVANNFITFSSQNWNLYYTPIGSSLRMWDGTADRITGGAVTTGGWKHIALTRSGTSVRLFIDGVQTGSTWTDAGPTNLGQSSVLVGHYPASPNYFTGHIDSLRITRGAARYTANFTPPAEDFYANLYVAATPLGSYSIDTAGHTGELNVIALDDVAGSTGNDRIIRTTGV